MPFEMDPSFDTGTIITSQTVCSSQSSSLLVGASWTLSSAEQNVTQAYDGILPKFEQSRVARRSSKDLRMVGFILGLSCGFVYRVFNVAPASEFIPAVGAIDGAAVRGVVRNREFDAATFSQRKAMFNSPVGIASIRVSISFLFADLLVSSLVSQFALWP
jgi:hypothetical protein